MIALTVPLANGVLMAPRANLRWRALTALTAQYAPISIRSSAARMERRALVRMRKLHAQLVRPEAGAVRAKPRRISVTMRAMHALQDQPDLSGARLALTLSQALRPRRLLAPVVKLVIIAQAMLVGLIAAKATSL